MESTNRFPFLHTHDGDGATTQANSTTIDLFLSLFPWTKFHEHKAAVKMHTLLGLHGNILTFIRITNSKVHAVNILDISAFVVVRTKSTVLIQRRYSHLVDKNTGVRTDQTVLLTSFESASAYPDPLRRVSYLDAETDERLKFLTNNFALPTLTSANLQAALAS